MLTHDLRHLQINNVTYEQHWTLIKINIHYNEPQLQKLLACASSEDSDHPAPHVSHILMRIFTERILDIQGCEISLRGQRRLCLDCADAPADLSVNRSHISEDTFSDVAALSVHILEI